MKIHYNNGNAEKIIDNVIAIQVVDGSHPLIVLTERGKEYQVNIGNVEMILNDDLVGKK